MARAGNTVAVGLTHLDADGRASMVDVGDKPASSRQAVASGLIRLAPETLSLVLAGEMPKGDVGAVARLAGIQAAKQTWQLVPLCHALPLSHVDVVLAPEPNAPALRVTATVRATARTGVEMEALTAVTTALLTVYDMCKAVDRAMVIGDVAVHEKTGGTRGDYYRGEAS